jgi:hypothetical protein
VVGSDRVRAAHQQARDVDQRQPVMLVVIRQKAEQFVAEQDPRRQYRLVPCDHSVELSGSQNEMRKFGRADRPCRVEVTHGGNIVHLGPRRFSAYKFNHVVVTTPPQYARRA